MATRSTSLSPTFSPISLPTNHANQAYPNTPRRKVASISSHTKLSPGGSTRYSALHDRNKNNRDGLGLEMGFGGRSFGTGGRGRMGGLGILGLMGVLMISFLLNVRLLLGDKVFRHSTLDLSAPLSILATLPSPNVHLKHLIIVPGHAIWTGCDASSSAKDSEWLLEEFQKDGKSVETILKHITKGAELAVQDQESLLIYSGGQTRPHSDMTEATSYARLAKNGNIYAQYESRDPTSSIVSKGEDFSRVTTEEYALDSLENVIFSIARFKEFTGHYPLHITIVGYAFKSPRYSSIHLPSVRWPETKFKYIGIDNEGRERIQGDIEGERVGGLEPYLHDMYGCQTVLLAKRKKRNQYRRFHPYHSSAPELEALLEYCPEDNKLFTGKLPWTT